MTLPVKRPVFLAWVGIMAILLTLAIASYYDLRAMFRGSAELGHTYPSFSRFMCGEGVE